MRTRTRAYAGGEVKKVVSKPVTTKFANLQNKFKSKGTVTKITPISSRRVSLAVNKKTGKQDLSSKKPSISISTSTLSKKQPTPPGKRTPAADRHSKTNEKSGLSSGKTSESRTMKSTKRSADLTRGDSAKKSKDSPRRSTSRIVMQDVATSSKKITGSAKAKRDATPKAFKSPKANQVKSVNRSGLSERKASDKKAARSSAKSASKSLDELSSLARPSLLSKSTRDQSGQKRKRATADDKREPALKRSNVSQMVTVTTKYTSVNDKNGDAMVATKSLLETPLSSQVRYAPVEGMYKTSSSYALNAPAAVASSSRLITGSSSRMIDSTAAALPGSSSRDSVAAGASDLLSPDKRGVWEIEGRRSTLLEKLWSLSPTNVFKFNKNKNNSKMVDDGREIASGFSYRVDHHDTDLNTSSLQSLQELETTPSGELHSAAMIDKKTLVDGAATKQLTSREVKKSKMLHNKTALTSAVKKSKHSMITRRCVACTAVSVVTCVMCCVLAFMSVSYLYT